MNARVEKLWKEWCKKQNCDVTGTQNFNAMMRMAIQRKKIDGGILFLKRYTAGGLMSFKLQALEVDELDIVAISPKTKGNKAVSYTHLAVEPKKNFLKIWTHGTSQYGILILCKGGKLLEAQKTPF